MKTVRHHDVHPLQTIVINSMHPLSTHLNRAPSMGMGMVLLRVQKPLKDSVAGKESAELEHAAKEE